MSQENEPVIVPDVKGDIIHYQYLDALRGLAALLVLAIHLSALTVLLGKYSFGFGAYGVQLFYILSALTLFLSSNQRFSTEARPVAKFFLRRFFRIAPLFYLAVIIAYLFSDGVTYRLPVSGVSINNIIAHFFFVFGFNKYWINSVIGVEWSIFCEVLFYLTLPLVFKYIKSKKQALYLLGFSLLVYIVFKGAVYLFNRGGDLLLAEWSSVFILSNYFYFALGILLYFIIRQPLRVRKAYLYFAWLVLFAGVILMITFGLAHFGALLFSVFAFLLVYLMSNNLPVNIIFNNRFTRFIGQISYSMYLWHYLVLGWFAKYLINPNSAFFASHPPIRIGSIILVIFSVVFISYLSYILIEKPSINLGRRLIKKMKAPLKTVIVNI